MAKNPFEVFPREIWVEIFDRVKEDPQDWLNLYRASSSFEEIVGDKKPDVLFPKVFSLVFKWLWKGSLVNVVGLRKFSRAWKDGVDKGVESLVVKNPNDRGTMTWKYHPYLFQSANRITSFLNKFDGHPRNPLIGRSLALDYTRCYSRRKMEEYNDAVRQLMEKYGSELRVLSVEDVIYLTSSSFHNPAHGLQSVMKLAPRLEKLSVEVELNDIHMRDTDNVVPFTQGEAEEPIIRNLKALHFSSSSDYSYPWTTRFLMDMQSMLLRMCANNPDSLRMVTCRSIPPLLLKNFPKLESASFKMLDEADFSNFAKASWPLLSKLTLISYSYYFPKLVELAAAAPVKDTLTSLVVRDTMNDDEDECEQSWEFRVELPRLKNFTTNRFVSFGSFANLSNLEVIRLEMDGKYGSRATLTAFCERVGFHVLRTRIWEVLPKLNRIEVQEEGPKSRIHSLARGECDVWKRM